MLLACVGLRFRHPASGAILSIAAPPGERFAEIIERFGWAAAVRDDDARQVEGGAAPYRPVR
jgi:hypothetical protein